MARPQADTPTAAQGRDQGEISLWLRIGVLGHRNVRPDHPGLIDAIDAALAAVNHELAALRVPPTRVCLAAVSSLAEGADRILAREILAREADTGRDARLEVILPLDKENYREDFGSAESRLSTATSSTSNSSGGPLAMRSAIRSLTSSVCP